MGGGTSEVPLLTTEDGIFEVTSTHVTFFCGGEDSNNRIADLYIQDFKRKFQELQDLCSCIELDK